MNIKPPPPPPPQHVVRTTILMSMKFLLTTQKNIWKSLTIIKYSADEILSCPWRCTSINNLFCVLGRVKLAGMAVYKTLAGFTQLNRRRQLVYVMHHELLRFLSIYVFLFFCFVSLFFVYDTFHNF